MPFTFDDETYDDVVLAQITDADEFTKLLTSHLSEGCQFLLESNVADGIKPGQTAIIGDTLLGSISEFAVFVICCVGYQLSHPFIGCFRAADPFGKGNFPLVDVRIFFHETNPAKDMICLLEIKTTRQTPSYFKKTLEDYSAMFTRSRLSSTAEHLKADLKNAGHWKLIPRVNDCIEACPKDSKKIELNPTGVSDASCGEDVCVSTLQDIVETLTGTVGWPNAEAICVLIPDIEATYVSFAIGEGDE